MRKNNRAKKFQNSRWNFKIAVCKNRYELSIFLKKNHHQSNPGIDYIYTDPNFAFFEP